MGSEQAVKKKSKWLGVRPDYGFFELVGSMMRDHYLYEVAEIEKGYKEMAEINLGLSELCFEVESEVEQFFEQRIAECE